MTQMNFGADLVALAVVNFADASILVMVQFTRTIGNGKE